MNRAENIVNRLLEAVPNGTTIRYGANDTSYGREFPSLEAAVGQPGEEAMQAMMRRGYSFVVQKNPNDIGVYSSSLPIKTAEGAVRFAAGVFGITPETQVHYGNSQSGVPLSSIYFEEPIKGGEAQAMRPDPNREFAVSRISKEPVTQNIPLDWGFYAVKLRQGTEGVRVDSIASDGPAATSGLMIGDRIVAIGPFETERGSFGPYRIRNFGDWERVTKFVQHGYSVPLAVVRRGYLIDDRIPIVPVPKKSEARGSGVQQVTGEYRDEYSRKEAEIKRKLEGSRGDVGSFTLAELAQMLDAQPSMVQVALNDLGIRVKDYAPNERDPASKTGNQPANPSALT